MKSCYIHIPFCENICTYCDFCKMYYNSAWADKYLEQLEYEIKKNYSGEKLSTIYIGGGTPTCLNEQQLEKLLNILNNLNKEDDVEYTIETNIESLNLDKIKLLKRFGINRVSVGLQSIVSKNINYLGRHHNKQQALQVIKSLQSNGFDNINVDLIYALPGQTLDELKEDIDFILQLDIQHISTYSLIIEDNTKLGINNVAPIDDDLDYHMYKYICKRLQECGFTHYEVSNFSKDGYESRHNLTYWNNDEYYGFGLGASGYVGNIRYDNTRSLNKYLIGNYRLNEEEINLNTKIENEFILGFRKLSGINKEKFKSKYNIEITNIEVVAKLINNKSLIDDGINVYIDPEKIYVSNSILVEFIGGSYGED